MAYFPLFLDMTQRRVLLIGGGRVAMQKLEKLLDFTTNITVIAKEVNAQMLKLIHAHQLSFQQKAYERGEIQGFDVVIVATDIPHMHQEIYEESRSYGILVNTVDDIAYCDFIFPSYVQKGELTVAFSTSGSSPAFAKKLKEYVEKKIPDSVESFLLEMKKKRQEMPKGRARMDYLNDVVASYFAKYFR